MSVGLLDVHVEIGVRVLPVELRERAGEVAAILAVELRRERVVREPGSDASSDIPQAIAATPSRLRIVIDTSRRITKR